MNNNAWFRKEKPLLSLQSMGGGASGTLMQGAADKTKYIDEVFSTYVYIGNGGAHQITNNIDNSKGGLVWMKNRDRSTYASNLLFDTERGSTKYLLSDTNEAEATSGSGTGINTFNEDGFTLQGNGYGTNYNTENFASWNFRKQEGFCDIVTYTGTGSATTVSHGLGSVPGLIMIKCTSIVNSWYVYHRDLGATKYMMLNNTNAEATQSWFMNDTTPTSTEFSLGSSANVNGSGETYVAYIFAGGSSTAATATSVDFDGTGDYLDMSYNWLDNYSFGTGDFTIEGWFKWDNNASGLFQISSSSGGLTSYSFATTPCVWMAATDTFSFNANGSQQTTDVKGRWGQWTHVAYVRESNKTSLYINGTVAKRVTDNQDYGGWALAIGGYYSTSYLFDGKISNFRIVKGTAVYTDSFKPPTEPLTNITGTQLLCCQGSTATAATVVPTGSLTANGDPTADTTDSPFDDPDGFKFSADENQNIVKVGKYIGNGTGSAGSEDGTIINTGWEPQWLLVKNIDLGSEPWMLMDCMRGIPTYPGSGDQVIYPNQDSAEATISNIDLTPNGFLCVNSDDKINGSGHSYIYMAIRRPDGLVGKPPSAGTGVFAMDTGNSSTTQGFTSGFPVDFALEKKTSATSNWEAAGRLIQEKYLLVNSNNAEATFDKLTFDDNTGWNTHSGYDSVWQSWMWKRGQGFDMVTYFGNPKIVLPDKGTPIPHSLNAVPEMIWTKGRNSSSNWNVYHKGLNGGTNPEQYYMELDNYNAEATGTNRWNDTAPTSTHFFVGDNSDTGATSDQYIAMLFASVNDIDGNPISKVGSFTPDSSGSFTVTLGFTPRFMVLKPRTFSDNNWGWWVYDSQRGLTSGLTNRLTLESTAAQISGSTNGTTATGINFTGWGDQSANNWIYYAHA